jgi:peptidyl-dipeptidase Dcp
MAGKAIMTLSRSFVEPFLKTSTRRDLREKVFKAFTARGDNSNDNDNNTVIVEILSLREESAKLLGFPTFAAYRLEDSMAKTPEAVRGLLERVWKPARARALADRDTLQGLVPRRAATSRWRRGTGATTPRSCGSAAPISTTPRSSLISCSTT